MRNFLFLCAIFISTAASADLTYPVDHTAQWQVVDTNSCTTVGGPSSWPAIDPDTYDCATDPCGIDPGYPENYEALKVVHADPFPSYDSNLSQVSSPYIMCGPDVSTCYDSRCSNTDEMSQVHEVTDLSQSQRLESLNNQAAFALLQSVPEADRDLMVWLSVSMLMQLADGASLPTDWQGVNFQSLYDSYKTRYRETASPVVIRRTELRDRIIDGSIQDGEIGSGWPAAAE